MTVSKPESNKDTSKKNQYRADNLTLSKIDNEIKSMFVNLHSSDQICKHIQDKYHKSNSVVRGYLAKALKDYNESAARNIDDIRVQNQAHLLEKYREMLRIHDVTGNNKYITHAISYYDRYIKLFPNALEPLVEEQEGSINITFNRLDINE